MDLVAFIQFPHDDHHARQLNESQKDRSVMFIANDKTAEVLAPASRFVLSRPDVTRDEPALRQRSLNYKF